MKGGARRLLTTQICDVSKPLMSVRRMVEMGHTVVFSPTEQYVYDEGTGEVMEMDLDGGMYTLKTWVKAGVFRGMADDHSRQRASKTEAKG